MTIKGMGNDWGVTLSNKIFSKGAYTWALRIKNYPKVDDFSKIILGVLEENITNEIIEKPMRLIKFPGVYGVSGKG